MCGIALVLEIGNGTPIPTTLDTLAAMHEDLARRGPDGEGWLVLDQEFRPYRTAHRPTAAEVGDALGGRSLRLATAFRRLAIRDLRDEAGQPIPRANGACWICLNGEIYNDRELRTELGGSTGATFATTNDAETMLAAYEAWGDACFARLRGMWAAVIVDLRTNRLIICRDRLGIKPLYFAHDGTRLLVASHPRTLAKAMAAGPRLDPVRWQRFLHGFPADHADGSFFAGVRAVPAGTFLSIDLRAPELDTARLAEAGDAPSFRRYWTLDGCLPDPNDRRDARTLERELLGLLEGSTREHLIADRSVGCMLSGGLDSSIVACLAARGARGSGPPPVGYSIVYADPRMSEWPYIQTVAAHAGMTAVTHQLTPAEAWDSVDFVVAAQGEPLLGQDAIAHNRLYRLAKEHGCVVTLEGHAADELFAGLPSYESVMFREWMDRGAWRRLMSEARLRARAQGRSLWAVLKDYAVGPTVRRWRRLPHRPSWLAANGHQGADAAETSERSADPSRLNRYLFDLVRHTNLPAVLAAQDRNAMSHGVENRPPFCDHRIVEWAFRLPSSAKVGGGRRKRVLWLVARQVVPQTVWGRTDKRAIVSRADWMPLKSAHRDALLEMIASPTLRTAPFIDGPRMTQFVQDYLRGDHHDEMGVWRLYTGWRWLEQFRPAS